MKKTLLTFLLLFQTTFSFASVSRPPAQALEWWLNTQGKFKGSSVCTAQNENGNFSITKWNVDGINQPTDKELDKIIDDYISSVAQNIQTDATQKQAVLSKLGITDDEFKSLLKG